MNMKFVKKKGNLNFNFLKNLFITKEIFLEYEPWIYRISEGEYEWVAALHATSPNPLSNPINPTTVYAYKVKDPEGVIRYMLAYFPEGCGESACATYFSSEASDENLGEVMEFLIAKAYELEMGKIDPEEFYDEVSWKDLYEIEPSEVDEYEVIRPTPNFGRKILDYLKKLRPSLEVSSHISPRK
jgi:hypothetical protein